MTDYGNLQTPRGHQAVLIEPDPSDLLASLRASDAQPLASAALLDTHILAVRRHLRERLGLPGPVILTGHQAEFFHAGVFAKSVAADAIAAAAGGKSVYITVDTDTPKSDQLFVPTIDGRIVHRRHVPIPGTNLTLPMNAQPELAASAWRSFFDDIAGGPTTDEPTMLDVYKRGWFDGAGEAIDCCAAFIRANAACEDALGFVHAPQLRTSDLSTWPEFRAFVAHLAANAASFRSAYNDSQLAYRARRHVRSPQRPVPPLMETDERIELPFWIVRGESTRRRLFVCPRGEHLAFFADAEHAGNECARDLVRGDRHAEPWRIETDGWRILPRALTLSAFCRLCLSDLFIHGIGGAKYDEMTEDFITRFWGIPVPASACVTATVHLDLPDAPDAEAGVRAARRAARDVRYNPQRHADGLPPDLLARREQLIAESGRLARDDRWNRSRRREVFKAIRDTNAALLDAAGDRPRELDDRVRQLEQELASHAAATDREYFYALHSLEQMQALAARIRQRLA